MKLYTSGASHHTTQWWFVPSAPLILWPSGGLNSFWVMNKGCMRISMSEPVQPTPLVPATHELSSSVNASTTPMVPSIPSRTNVGPVRRSSAPSTHTDYQKPAKKPSSSVSTTYVSRAAPTAPPDPMSAVAVQGNLPQIPLHAVHVR